MASVLNVAIIGAGAMGLEHIRNLKLIGNTKVVCVADSNERSRLEARALLDEDSTVVADYRELLTCKHSIHAIILATPNFSHINILREIIPWKRHLLVEKPMCTTVDDCLEVQELLATHMPQLDSNLDGQHAATGLASSLPTTTAVMQPLFWVGMEYRYMPPMAKLLSIVDSGSLGKVHMVHMREHRFPFLLKVAEWNRFSELTGGTLVEKCCHFWDLMRRIVGPNAKASRVFASGGMDVNHKDEQYQVRKHEGLELEEEEEEEGGEGASRNGGAGGGNGRGGLERRNPDIVDNAFVIVEFDCGVRGCLDLCMFAEDRQHEEVSVVGSQGKVVAEAPECLVTHHTPSQRASGANPSNQRVPPAPGTFELNTVVCKTHVDDALLSAGYHEGATFFELKAFVEAVTLSASSPPSLLPSPSSTTAGATAGSVAGRGVVEVTCEDGLAAVAIGVAAEQSIKLKREVLLEDVMAEAEAKWRGRKESGKGGETKGGSSDGSEVKRQRT